MLVLLNLSLLAWMEAGVPEREVNVIDLSLIRLLKDVRSDLQPTGPAGSAPGLGKTPPPVLDGTR